MTLSLAVAYLDDLVWCRDMTAAHHYLHTPPDPRSRPMAYVVRLGLTRVGSLYFARPEATACYRGALTYGSQADVTRGRAEFDRWEVLNLARLWLDPAVQAGGRYCRPELVPGFTDRRGTWRPTVASAVIALALARVGFDYLRDRPPCFVEQPYAIRAVLSYCDTRLHRGAVYRASGFVLARRNQAGIETYFTRNVGGLSIEQDALIRQASATHPRSLRIRAARAQGVTP